MIRTPGNTQSDIPIIRERGGRTIFVLLFLLCASVAVVILWEHVRYERAQPLYTQAFDGEYGYVSYLAIVTVLAGILASLMLI